MHLPRIPSRSTSRSPSPYRAPCCRTKCTCSVFYIRAVCVEGVLHFVHLCGTVCPQGALHQRLTDYQMALRWTEKMQLTSRRHPLHPPMVSDISPVCEKCCVVMLAEPAFTLVCMLCVSVNKRVFTRGNLTLLFIPLQSTV